ncbi:MAG: response regulator [Cytophagales bacterium]|nr:MAG: response regulator [Cytophagales bacterium]TAF60945.1 MAG: response regulator [Cytophagales bacterium]
MEQKKLLIAEDSSVIQNVMAKVLKFQNYEIDYAKNGVQVLTKLEGKDFDVILMDINMPEMDGMVCAKKIRALAAPQKSTIPIIAVTGNAQNYSIEDFKDAGITDYLPKPIDFDVLINKLNELWK